ncbi:Hypothetical Protein FCC1311_062142 [Hondaea fermentalgiana]|uniref:Uncharacterized protein n=1 Tax=Hondaea fermentalgiana TaxID=2315210 RepID=A0A2R5GQ31_9STRA|nr:Hypothetical Protein FCC1311_062142 [Hondaea fermentalgiana]|eukprot:GBG29994.1 Hypothetical Protein FCC1311_062142 [Hondaea fermentalgiana]
MLEDVALFSKTDPPNKVKTLLDKKARSPSHSGKEGLVDQDAQSSNHVDDLKTNRGVGIMSGGSSEKAGDGAVGDIVPSQQLNLSALSGASTAQLAQNLVPILRTGKLTSDAKKLWANVSVSRLLGLRKRGDPNHRGRFKANTIVGKNTINNSGHWRTVEVTNMLWMHHTGYMDSHRPASLPSWPNMGSQEGGSSGAGAGGAKGPSVLELDIKELENAIEHLERSNTELAAFLEEEGPDQDLSQAVEENLAAIGIKRCRLAKLKDLLEEAQGVGSDTKASVLNAENLQPSTLPAESAIGDGAGKTPVELRHEAPQASATPSDATPPSPHEPAAPREDKKELSPPADPAKAAEEKAKPNVAPSAGAEKKTSKPTTHPGLIL